MTDCESLKQAVKDYLKLIRHYRDKVMDTKTVQEFSMIYPSPNLIIDKGEEILKKAMEEE